MESQSRLRTLGSLGDVDLWSTCVRRPSSGIVARRWHKAGSRTWKPASDLPQRVVGDTGFEPVTSSVSRKRATAAPIAPVMLWIEVGTGFEPVYTDLQSVASPLGQPTVDGSAETLSERTTRLELATSTLARLRSTN